jgi:hypothetical protein
MLQSIVASYAGVRIGCGDGRTFLFQSICRERSCVVREFNIVFRSSSSRVSPSNLKCHTLTERVHEPHIFPRKLCRSLTLNILKQSESGLT